MAKTYFDKEIERILEVFSIEDLIEMSDQTIEAAVAFLYLEGFIKLPDVKPLVFDDD